MTRSGHETLLQRVENTRARQGGHSTQDLHGKRPADRADALRSETSPAPNVKHCWYDGPHGRQAALLLEWRCIDGGYDGRIVVLAPEPDGWAVVEMWVESGVLLPA